MRAPPTVRAAREEDAPRIVRTLARAFDGDANLNWLVRQDAKRRAAIEQFFDITLRKMTLPFGCVEIADEADGVALWAPPGKWEVGLLTQLALAPSFARVLSLRRAPTRVPAINRLTAKHPRTPHYYLFSIAADPDRQGRGLGAALLASMLARCDAEGMPAYLEASSKESRRLYERHGFVTTEEFRMAKDAPPMWLMWREPLGR